MAQIYRCKEPFAFVDKHGVPRSVAVGTLVSGDDPDFKNKLNLFESVETAVARATSVEDASAEPGSLRSVSTRGRGRPRRESPTEQPPAETPAEEES